MAPWLHRAARALMVAAAVVVTEGATGLAAAPPTPTLTVVGFGVVSLPPAQAAPPQLELNLNVHGATASAALKALDGDLAAIERRLKAMGLRPSALDAQGPPQLNYITSAGQAGCRKAAKVKPGLTCPAAGFAASEGLQVTFPSLASLARVLSRTDVARGPGVQNFWVNQGGTQAARPAAAALAAGYGAALADARASALALAAAEGVVLVRALSVTEGAQADGGCGMGGCGPTFGVSPPPVGPNQMLVAVTVTYATRLRA